MNLANHVKVASNKEKQHEKKESRVVSKMSTAKDAQKRKFLQKRFNQMERQEKYDEK